MQPDRGRFASAADDTADVRLAGFAERASSGLAIAAPDGAGARLAGIAKVRETA
jgi:hypothetical protein